MIHKSLPYAVGIEITCGLVTINGLVNRMIIGLSIMIKQ